MTPSLYKSSFDTGYVQYVSNSFYPYLFPFCPSFSAEMSTCSAPITVIIHIFKHRLLHMCGIDFSMSSFSSTRPTLCSVLHSLANIVFARRSDAFRTSDRYTTTSREKTIAWESSIFLCTLGELRMLPFMIW